MTPPIENLKEPLDAFFGPGVPVVNMILLVSLLKTQFFQVSSVAWCSRVSLATLFLSFVLHLVGMNIRKDDSERWRCGIAYLSTVLRMVAAASLLLFLGEAHTVVVAPLLLLALSLVSLFGWETFHGARLGANWGDFNEQLKRHFELSAQVVTVAFSGLNGTVLGYVKGPSHQTTGGGYMAPECFLFYAAVLGLLVVLLCTVPTRILSWATRSRMANGYLPILAYASLLFLVLAGVMAAEEILRQYVFFVCFAFVLLAMACLLEENHSFYSTELTKAAGEQDVMISKFVLAGYILTCFAGLMATRLKYSTGSGLTVSTSWWLKGFVLSALCGILTYAVRMVVFMWLPHELSAFTKIVWMRGMYLSMASTLVCFSADVLLHPDEVQNTI